MSELSETAEATRVQHQPSGDVSETLGALPIEGDAAATENDSANHADTLSRWPVTILFWALCLLLSASGHWVYVAIRTIDRHISHDLYRSPGREIVWVGHDSLEQSVRSASARLPIVPEPYVGNLTALPLSPFWGGVGIAFAMLATIAVWSGKWICSDGLQSLVGLLAGHAIWIGVIEIGLDLGARRLGLAGALDFVGLRLAGVHGSAVLIQLSAIFLLPIFVGLAIHESNRCVVFQWFRRKLPLTKFPGASGRVGNYAARTMTQFFMTVWVCYVAVLWMADPLIGFWGHAALLTTLVAIAAATPYMIWKTLKQTTRARMLRFSVSGAVITWTGIEIASATGMIGEPWLNGSLGIGVLLVGGSAALTATSAVALSSGGRINREFVS